MTDRIVGILGGMGPEATADLYYRIIRLTPASTDQEHIRVLIYSNPKVPDRTRAILYGGEDPVPCLIESARILEKAGAGILAVPCNSAHYFLPRVEKEIGIPILNMVEETYRTLQSRLPHGRKVGILGTTGSVRAGLYRSCFAGHGVEVMAPEEADLERVHEGIQKVKAGTYDRENGNVFEAIGSALVAKGAEAVILGCTEIPLAFDESRVDYPVLNPTEILARAVVDWALEKEE